MTAVKSIVQFLKWISTPSFVVFFHLLWICRCIFWIIYGQSKLPAETSGDNLAVVIKYFISFIYIWEDNVSHNHIVLGGLCCSVQWHNQKFHIQLCLKGSPADLQWHVHRSFAIWFQRKRKDWIFCTFAQFIFQSICSCCMFPLPSLSFLTLHFVNISCSPKPVFKGVVSVCIWECFYFLSVMFAIFCVHL